MIVNRDDPESRQQLTDSIIASPGGEAQQHAFALSLDYYMENSTIGLQAFSEYLNQCMPNSNLQVVQLGGGNNKNFVVTNNENTSVVVQFGENRPAADVAMSRLMVNGKLPIWCAQQYANMTKDKPGLHDQAIDKKLNPFNVTTQAHVTVMERCAISLEGRIDAMHQGGANTEEIIAFAQNIGGQVNYILNDLNKSGVLWTDMKIGNLLLRENNAVVVADRKAFLPTEQMIMRMNKESGAEQVKLEDVTDTYLSKYFNDKSMSPVAISRDDAVHDFQKEYSNQLGMMIYSIATGLKQEDFISMGFEGELRLNFKFPIFKGQEGQNLQFIIESLTNTNPFARMEYQDAFGLLKVVKDQDKFNEMREEVSKKMDKQDLTGKSTLQIFGRMMKGKASLKEALEQKRFSKEMDKYEPSRRHSDSFGKVTSKVEAPKETEAKQEREVQQRSMITKRSK